MRDTEAVLANWNKPDWAVPSGMAVLEKVRLWIAEKRETTEQAAESSDEGLVPYACDVILQTLEELEDLMEEG